ncbi:MAG: hypothetical protein IKA54_06660 [Clostridia bacterium]|nr:hypothetical protein [Clostridia bacterium]
MEDLHGIIGEFLEGNIKALGGTPVIEEKTITENGTYNAPEGVDGFDPVIVNVPIPEPVIMERVFAGNGTYNPPEGVDGYAPVIIDVPSKEEVTLSATENGTYTPPSGKVYDGAIVNVPSIGNVIVNKSAIVSNRVLQTVACNLTQGKYYAVFYYDDYLYPRSSNVLGCTAFCRTASGSTEQRFYMNYANFNKDLYCTDTGIYLKTKFDNDAVNCYITVVEIDDSVITPLIPT